MTNLTISELISAANKLTVEDQLVLNKALCVMIRTKRKTDAIISSTKFFPTQIVKFNAKTRGIRMLKIEKFNRAHTAVVGYEVDETGKQVPYSAKWTVSITLCTPV